MLSDFGVGSRGEVTWVSLNPCSGGLCSLTIVLGQELDGFLRLNPCSGGL